MPVTLTEATQALKLHGLKWVCCECLTVNKPGQVECVQCGKQRWVQLGFGRAMAAAQAQCIVDEGHGA